MGNENNNKKHMCVHIYLQYSAVLGSVVRVGPNADEGDALVAQKLFNNVKPKALRSKGSRKAKQKHTSSHGGL